MKYIRPGLLLFTLLGAAAAIGCGGSAPEQRSEAPQPPATVQAASTQDVGGEPHIELTEVPSSDCGGPGRSESIAGKVTGVVPRQHFVVLYALACNGTFYLQPTIAAPFTRIEENGSFDAFIHLGHTYYALLVKPGFKPVPELQAEPRSGGDILAVAKTRGRGASEGESKKN